jgi:hypothetical protein
MVATNKFLMMMIDACEVMRKSSIAGFIVDILTEFILSHQTSLNYHACRLLL